MLFSKGSSQLRDQTQVSRNAGRFFTISATREAHNQIQDLQNFSPFCGLSFLFADGAVKGRGAGEAKHETCEFSFIWGLTEDCSLGDSLADSSEDLLGRGGDRGQCVYDSGEGGTSNQAHISGETCC